MGGMHGLGRAGIVRPLVVLAVGLWACQGKLLSIRIAESAETVVPAGTPLNAVLGDLGFGDFLDMDLTTSQELANQGVAPGDIVDTYLQLLELEATRPSSADLSFLSEMQIYAEAPGLPPVLVASGFSFPEGERSVALTVEPVDISDYVTSQSMTLRTDVSGQNPDEATTVEARFELSVGVTVQGACNAIQGDGGN